MSCWLKLLCDLEKFIVFFSLFVSKHQGFMSWRNSTFLSPFVLDILKLWYISNIRLFSGKAISWDDPSSFPSISCMSPRRIIIGSLALIIDLTFQSLISYSHFISLLLVFLFFLSHDIQLIDQLWVFFHLSYHIFFLSFQNFIITSAYLQ